MISEEDVKNGFFYCLGRYPESQHTIDVHRNFKSIEEFRSALMESAEYKALTSYFEYETWVCKEVLEDKKIWLDLSDRYVSRGCLLDDYEPIESNFIRDSIKEGDTFLDIGANIGWFSLLASKLVGSKGKIVAFEPRKTTFKYLTKSISQNRIGKYVKAHNLALADKPGSLEIGWAEGTPNPGGTHLVFSKNENYHYQTVDVKTLDSFFNKDFSKVDFIKIDVEGAE